MKDISLRNQVLLVCAGAIPGALLRSQLDNSFLANILGVFLLGLICGLKLNSRSHFFWILGFCGSFTTFSSWMVDAFALINAGFLFRASVLIGSTLIAGFLSLTLGFLLGKTIKQLFPSL